MGARSSAGEKSAGVASSVAVRKKPVVIFFGTSLTAGPGLETAETFPALVEGLADSAGIPFTAVNAGVSGETSAGAVRRIEWVLRTPADIVVIESGANDALRGLDPDSARSNIVRIIQSVKRLQPLARIALVQMEAPPNMGFAYVRRFGGLYRDVAKKERVTLIPFLLAGVAGDPALNLGDGVHPNPRGAKIVAANVWKGLEQVVREVDREAPKS